jgi:predicted GH43/DUF377 family glycosyl hydrolase/mannose-6-phosphate isomerase-like protein (cupin superfamily)
MTDIELGRQPVSLSVPYMLTRLGVVMSADRSDPLEAEGVLNPASAWGGDGELYLYPRLVAAGNVSRVGKARVVFADGVPIGVERRGVALAPDRAWERGRLHGGVEDARITSIPALGVHVMTYVAFGPIGPRPALAVSADLLTWRRLGPLQFQYDDALDTDLNLFPNKDVVFFPEVVVDPQGRPSYALMHRPMWDLSFMRRDEKPPLPTGLTDSRPSIWISYIPAEEAEADITALTRPHGHRLVATPEFEWESLKIGAGPPPIRVAEGWLLIYHGVSGDMDEDAFARQDNVCYVAGAMILSAANPVEVIARAPQPLLVPEAPQEVEGIVANVVFPTAIEQSGEACYVFYGMADSQIGVARLDGVQFAQHEDPKQTGRPEVIGPSKADRDAPSADTLAQWSFQPRRVEKPWGWELIWAHTEFYVGKVLFLRAGHSLSLQFHNEKDESWYVESGRATLELGDAVEFDADEDRFMKTAVISTGACFHFHPHTIHRVTALQDTTILEVSTPHLDDVVRLEDAYGRAGTSTP